VILMRPSLLKRMTYLQIFAELSGASKEIWDKIYLNALQMFEIIDVSKMGKIV
jgi:hypothetical protein